MIKIKDIKKSFGQKEVLKGVSFATESGSIYGLIGKNGAGKTTLMKIMTGLLDSDAGTCDFSDNKNAVLVGYLPDLPEFYDYLTAKEYLDFLLHDQNPIRREKLLSMVGLEGDVKISAMSRGMRQRLGIAAVLTSDPDVILLDEPTSALDPEGRSDVRKILLSLKEEGKTILLSTHILADMDSICDRAGFLYDGVIVRETDVKNVAASADEWIVCYKTGPTLPKEPFAGGEVVAQEENRIRIRVDRSFPDAQKEAFLYLSRIPEEITSIKTTSKTLDVIFEEVHG